MSDLKLSHRPASTRQQGFTLIELLISMLLGLLVIAAAGGIFLSNRRVYGSTESINRIQENQRTAFEIMSRDIREAGGNPCTTNVVNMLDTSKPAGSYWDTWLQGVTGVDGGANNPDEVTLSMANGESVTVTKSENPSANLGISSQAGIQDNDIVMVCNPEVAAIFQVNGFSNAGGGTSVIHNSGQGNPGNEAKPFKSCASWRNNGVDDCEGTSNSQGYCFLPDASPHVSCSNKASGLPAQLVRPYAVRWFIRSVNRSGRNVSSLYRQVITNSVPGTADEIAEGVTDMQLRYKLGTAATYENASGAWTAAQWQSVSAIQVVLTLQATTGALSTTDVQGTDNQVLTRTLGDVVALRNRINVQ